MPQLNRRHLPTAMTNKKPTISASTRGELRGLIALFAVDQVMKQGDMKIVEQQLKIKKSFKTGDRTGSVMFPSLLMVTTCSLILLRTIQTATAQAPQETVPPL